MLTQKTMSWISAIRSWLPPISAPPDLFDLAGSTTVIDGQTIDQRDATHN